MGGTLSVADGGNFGSGALAGGISSGIGSATGGFLRNANKFWKAVGIVGSGSVSGGVGSRLGGGNFWDGFRQGAISSGLNHAVHAGAFGKNIAAAAITGRLRHVFGPDAKSISINGTINPFVGTNLEKGGIVVLRGNPSADDFVGLAGVIGTPTLSADVSITDLYFSGSVNSININTFTGTYYALSLGADFGIGIGVSASYSPVGTNFVIGFGANLGIGFSPLYGIDANLKIGRTSTTGNPFD